MWKLVDHWSDQRPPFHRYGHDSLWPGRIVTALAPTLAKHGIPPASVGQYGVSVVWCSHVSEVRIRNQEVEDPEEGCTDLWVELNPEQLSIAVHFEGEDLLCHASGVLSAATARPMELDDDLDVSLGLVAELLDRMCAELVVRRPG